MKTKYINLGEDCVSPSYPIGYKAERSLSFANTMAIKIGETIEEKETPIILWGRGSSGAVLCAFVHVKLKELGFETVNINHVKKPREDSHSDNDYYIGEDTTRHIIVDDIMCSGRTINAIYDVVSSYHEHPMLAMYDCYISYLSFKPQIVFTHINRK